IEVFEEEAKKLGGADFLVQGTLYPDVIESVSFTGGPSVTIKSHHNVGGLPERMNMKLVEPLRELFKDEVRLLGKELGLPDSFIGRHPFPGPGLAIRCPGGVTREKLEILREADAIYLDEIRKAGLYDAIWQAFAVLLPVQTVGVMGDGRTYEFVCALRAVTSVDGMTADFYPFDMGFIGRVATRIIHEARGVHRAVDGVPREPPGTSERAPAPAPHGEGHDNSARERETVSNSVGPTVSPALCMARPIAPTEPSVPSRMSGSCPADWTISATAGRKPVKCAITPPPKATGPGISR